MSALHLTRHAVVRMAQRGTRFDDLELAELIGTEVEGGYYVRRKDVQAYIREKKKEIERARRLAGKRVVSSADAIVTAYYATRAKARRLLRGADDRALRR